MIEVGTLVPNVLWRSGLNTHLDNSPPFHYKWTHSGRQQRQTGYGEVPQSTYMYIYKGIQIHNNKRVKEGQRFCFKFFAYFNKTLCEIGTSVYSTSTPCTVYFSWCPHMRPPLLKWWTIVQKLGENHATRQTKLTEWGHLSPRSTVISNQNKTLCIMR